MKKTIILFSLLLIVFKVHCQWYNTFYEAKAPVYKGNYEDHYGRSIAVNNNYAVIGCVGYNNMAGMAEVLHYNGENWERLAMLMASEPVTNDMYALSVAISDDFIAIGAYRSDFKYPDLGAVFIYEKPATGWKDAVQSEILSPSVYNSHSNFGRNLLISNQTLFVSASGENNEKGVVYIFQKSQHDWTNSTEVLKIESPSNHDGENFGRIISIYQNTLVVKSNSGLFVYEDSLSTWDNPNLIAHLQCSNVFGNHFSMNSVSVSDKIIAATFQRENVGLLYVFEKSDSGWVSGFETSLTQFPDDYDEQPFGLGLDIEDAIVAVGNPGSVNSWVSCYSSVDLLQKSEQGWSKLNFIDKISISDSLTHDYFGRVLQFHNNQLLVGATCNSDNDKQNGALYVFDFEKESLQFNQSQVFYPQSHDVDYINENYGRSVAIDGDYAVVGAPFYKQSIGCAYVLKFDGMSWNNIARLTTSSSNVKDGFGEEVKIKGDIIAVGAPGLIYSEDDFQGRAYIYKKPQAGWFDATETTTFKASDGKAQDRFGISIDIEDKTIVVGSENNSAYVFEAKLNDWTQIEELAALSVPNEWCGKKVSVHNENIFLLANDFVDVYKKPATGWSDASVTATLSSLNYPEFHDISVSDSFVHIVSFYGKIFIYKKKASDWVDAVEDTLLYSDSKNSSSISPWGVYYYCMAANKHLILIGEVTDTWGFGKYGEITAYECTSGNWLGGEITTSTVVEPIEKPEGYSGFGRSIDIDANNLIVGNVYQSAYIFTVNYNLAVSKNLNVGFNVFYFNETLNIKLKTNNTKLKTLTIYNLKGQQILTQTIHSANQTIDVSNLEKGYYLISVSDKAGNVVGSQGVVVY